MKLRGLQLAWLSPDGAIVTDADDFDGHAWHDDLAKCIIRDLEGLAHKCDYEDFIDGLDNITYAYEYLESIGWIRLARKVLRSQWIMPCPSPTLTRQQKDVVLRWCIANNVKWLDAFDVCDRDCCSYPAKH